MGRSSTRASGTEGFAPDRGVPVEMPATVDEETPQEVREGFSIPTAVVSVLWALIIVGLYLYSRWPNLAYLWGWIPAIGGRQS